MADINNETSMDLEGLLRQVSAGTRARAGRSGARDTRAFEFMGGFEGVDRFNAARPTVSVEQLTSPDAIGQVYFKYTESQRVGDVSNLSCFRLTGDLEFVTTAGALLSASEWLSLDALTRPVGEPSGKVQIVRMKYATALPLTLKVTEYREMWSLVDLARTCVPVEYLLEHLARVHRVATVAIEGLAHLR